MKKLSSEDRARVDELMEAIINREDERAIKLCKDLARLCEKRKKAAKK